MKEILSCKEAANVTVVSPNTNMRAIKVSQLYAMKIGEGKTCLYIISREAVTDYIQKREKM